MGMCHITMWELPAADKCWVTGPTLPPRFEIWLSNDLLSN